jgi:hypothetical protein
MGTMVVKFTCLSCDEIYLDKDRIVVTYKEKGEESAVTIDICKFCEKGPSLSLHNSQHYKLGFFRTYSKGPNNAWENPPELDPVEHEYNLSDDELETEFIPPKLPTTMVTEMMNIIADKRKEMKILIREIVSENESRWRDWLESKTDNKRVTMTFLHCANDDCKLIDAVPFIEEPGKPEGWRMIIPNGNTALELLVPILALETSCCGHREHRRKSYILSTHSRDDFVRLTRKQFSGREGYCDYGRPSDRGIILHELSSHTSRRPDSPKQCPFIIHQLEEWAYVMQIDEPMERLQADIPGLFTGSGYLCGNCCND